MHAGIGATLVFGAVPAFALFLFLLADDAAASFIASGSGIFYAWQYFKKEVNQLAALCNKQSPCMSGV
jgi:hypothetical protein